ncbi:flagellar protein [Bacillus sp. OxB-1]|uniref:flagellar protein FlaG n=1 Tax=Bacillus sp. (strain OxB-1) TaxID=98228 RepID=UPI000582305B|nr:flagellar protein FlaG [Bacillus sp. OxB-1]BAQ10208.1 flagellar protein [Bacillus sp. OxB-1]
MVSRIGGSPVTPQAGVVADSVASTKDVEMVSEMQAIRDNQQAVEQQVLPLEKAKQLTESMNNFLESTNTQLRFEFHDQLHEYYVTIVNSKTDEVVREIPSKKLMDMHAAMREFLGLLIDRKI